MSLTRAEADAIVRRANTAGFDSVAEYCLVLEQALAVIGRSVEAGPMAAVARLALVGRFTAIDDALGGPGV